MASLELGTLGNCTIGALIDRQGTLVWSCYPRATSAGRRTPHRPDFLVHRAIDRAGRAVEARELFDNMLACRNQLGLLSEHINPETNELRGNFPQNLPVGRHHQLRHQARQNLGGCRLNGRRRRS